MKNKQHIPARILIITCILATTFLYWGLLIFRIPAMESLPYWFWKTCITPLPMWWLILPMTVLSFTTIYYVLKHPNRTVPNISLLIMLGWCIQIMFSQMPGLGLYGITCRMTQTDHSMFAREAIEQSNPIHVTTDYYKMIKNGEIAACPHSTKPPGQLLFYMLTKFAARPLSALMTNHDPLMQIAIFSAFVYPFLTYLVLIPLYYVSKLFMQENRKFIPLILYLFIPNVTLMTLHLDQCLYPLLFMTPLGLFLHGLTRRNPHLIFLSGILTYAGMFVTFSLVPLLVLPCIYSVFAVLSDKSKRKELPKALALYFTGFACVYAFLLSLGGYNAAGGYTYAMTYHQAVKISNWTFRNIAYIGFVDILEFVIWTGIPVSLLCITGLFISPEKHINKNTVSWRALAFSLLAIVMLMAFAGKTVAETGRLWIFIVPLVCLSAGNACCWIFRKHRSTAVLSITTLQLLTIFLIKRYQDFF